MSLAVALAWLAAAFALLPLILTALNLRPGRLGFQRPADDPPAGTAVSILIPARNEEAQIGMAVSSALASRGVAVEVLVFDDQSSDATAAIVRGLAAVDGRVRLIGAGVLPEGWAGKQRACMRLAAAARHDVLMFVDADVQLRPDAAARAAALLLRDAETGLVSGFPAERAGSFGERLVVPWIHVLLLGYLPMAAMRTSRRPAFGTGCGQWMVARADAYRDVGGHAAAPLSRHDGLSLPRSFREAGWRTDLFDGSRLASCRMYRSFGETWHGFGKSAGEGMATPVGLPVWTLLIVLGHIAPWLLLAGAVAAASFSLFVPAAIGVAVNLLLRGLLVKRLGQPVVGALLHPVGAALVLAIQWQALTRHLSGTASHWKGRSYPPIGT